MEIKMNQIAVLLLEPQMTDLQLKEELLFLKDYQIKMVIVLPSYVGRAKQLLAGTAIQVGSVADYPLGAGTMAKQAYETGELYKNGATEVYITATLENLPISRQTCQTLAPLAFGRGDMGFFIDADVMNDEERSKLALQIGRTNIKVLFLGTDLSIENALFYLSIFRAAKERQLRIQVNVANPTLLDIEMLFQAGASVVGMNNPRDVLPLLQRQ